VQDQLADRLQELARTGGTDPRPLLAERSVFGDLADDEAFVARLQTALEKLTDDGVRATLAAAGPVAAQPDADHTATAESLPA
jgi:mannitol-1-phosphate/altronate dehydrogenase